MPGVELRRAAIGFAIGRALFGLGFVLAPARSGRGWLGELGESPAAVLTVRSIGARDLALGAGAALATLRGDGATASPWFAAHTVADLADVAGTALVGDEIPSRARNLALAVAGGSAVVATGFAFALARDRPPSGT